MTVTRSLISGFTLRDPRVKNGFSHHKSEDSAYEYLATVIMNQAKGSWYEHGFRWTWIDADSSPEYERIHVRLSRWLKWAGNRRKKA